MFRLRVKRTGREAARDEKEEAREESAGEWVGGGGYTFDMHASEFFNLSMGLLRSGKLRSSCLPRHHPPPGHSILQTPLEPSSHFNPTTRCPLDCLSLDIFTYFRDISRR